MQIKNRAQKTVTNILTGKTSKRSARNHGIMGTVLRLKKISLATDPFSIKLDIHLNDDERLVV